MFIGLVAQTKHLQSTRNEQQNILNIHFTSYLYVTIGAHTNTESKWNNILLLLHLQLSRLCTQIPNIVVKVICKNEEKTIFYCHFLRFNWPFVGIHFQHSTSIAHFINLKAIITRHCVFAIVSGHHYYVVWPEVSNGYTQFNSDVGNDPINITAANTQITNCRRCNSNSNLMLLFLE